MKGKIGKYTVGFLDILGFKEKLQNLTTEELARQYEDVVYKNGNILNTIDPENGIQLCQRFIFSDSIILFTEETEWKNVFALLLHAWKFSQMALVTNFPVRGAIAYGDMYVNSEDNIFLGEALTKAYELEQQQDWIGIVIDDSLTQAYPEFSQNHAIINDLFPEYPVPLKNGATRQYRTINWRWNLVVQEGTRFLFKETQNIKIQQKQKNTLNYAKKIKESGKLYPIGDQSEIPQIFRTFWSGKTFPPFEHGDDL